MYGKKPTGLVLVATGVMTLTHPRVRRSQNRTVRSCEPDTNTAPPHVKSVSTWPARELTILINQNYLNYFFVAY